MLVVLSSLSQSVLIRRILYFLVLTGFTLSAAAESNFQNVGKIVAVGDLHGDYGQYLQVLRLNNLVDQRLKWIAGDVHFVQMGDVTDRGPDSLKIIKHLMRLKKQARKAGGMVHILVGNHEAMNVQTDLRYVHPGEYEVLITNKSRRRQSQYVDAVFLSMLKRQPSMLKREKEARKNLVEKYPLGYVEHRMLWEPGRELANWYAGQDTVIQINDSLYVHGGLDPHAEKYRSLDDINKTIRRELKPGGKPALSVDQRGPLWYRGLAKHTEEEEREPVERMLEHYGVARIFVAHSTTQGAVIPRFERRVILADVGISAHYGSSMANIVIDGDVIYARHRGELVELPESDDISEYLAKTASLEPEGSRLIRYVDSLNAAAD